MQVAAQSPYVATAGQQPQQVLPNHGVQLSEHTYIGPVETFYPDQVRIGLVGDMLAGGIVGGMVHLEMAGAIDGLRSGFSWGGVKTLGSASLKAGALGAGISAVSSAVQNISALSKGLITTRDAISNVGTDSVGGLLGGTTAGLAAGAGSLALKSFGVAGLPLTIGAAAAGAIGGVGASKLFDATGLRGKIFNSIRDMIS